MRNCANILYQSLSIFLPKGGEGYVWAEKIMLLHIALKGAGAFHSAGQSKEGSVGFGTSQHPIFMKLLPDHLWH